MGSSRKRSFAVLGAVVLAALGWGAAGWARAGEPLHPAAPLSAAGAPMGSAGVGVAMAAAQRAQDLGMPSIAADILRRLLEEPGTDRAAVGLALATALIDADRPAEAEVALEAVPEPRGAAWRLRAGLAALQLRKRDVAQRHASAIKPEEVAEADRPWYWFLTGALYDSATPRDMRRANEFYVRAERAAATELARARFQLAGEQVRLRLLGQPSDADLQQARGNMDRFAGRPFGYDATRNYAAMLALAGRRAEAVEVLQRALAGLPSQERVASDELRFMLGLVGDRGRNGAGRNALGQLLENGRDMERQRQALELLAEASREEPLRGQFRAELERLAAVRPAHQALESLLYYTAQLALADKDFVRAEKDAMELLGQFPISPLRAHALGVLMQSAWEQGRFRLAADYARKARAEPGVATAPLARLELGVLEAEASYRAGDFRSAADAYAAVLRERPPEVGAKRVAELMHQRVLAEIKAESGEAARVLDEYAADPAFDLESRWQAEWSLARALQTRGEAGVREAYGRVSALLARPEGEVARPELRARMRWLQAKLAFDSGQWDQTARLADDFQAATEGVAEGPRAEMTSMTLLLKAQAELALGRELAGLETMRRLRAEHPRTDAAISSRLIEAEHHAAQDKIDEARRSLIDLTDNPEYKDSGYAPLALYRLALLSERLGQDENLREANRRIEELVKRIDAGGADPSLLFAARLKQGELFRKLNDFPSAQRAYEDLVNRYPQRPDVVLARLALAQCHNAQSSSDPSGTHAENALAIFEQLRDRLDAPRDVRVEAGYNVGALLARRGKVDEAALAWWKDVIHPFLLEEKQPLEASAKRPYWLARTLIGLGELQEKRGRIEEAKEAWLLLLRKGLPDGAATARAKLRQAGVTPPGDVP